MKMTPEQLATTKRGMMTIARTMREVAKDREAMTMLAAAHDQTEADGVAVACARTISFLNEHIEQGVAHLTQGSRMLAMHEIAVAEELKREQNVVALEGKACDE